ncbi:BCS1 N terminal-domain-containing protein [Aspergillus avenaceus]|uniref:BCS1 N terminal-domain-containing protein n=1 Tax=Aspergillus avenaceus TaxID=36643 RepID=A0A5N6TMD0_ASPAV|nr:BCS1 N terminal-domain-containing protein [Aspergillus avenaceus]
MDPNAPGSAPGLPSAGDIIVQQRKDAIQAAGQPAGDGLFAQLTSNPFFTAGFGLAGLGAGLSFAQKGVRHGAALLRRRMLVDVEISVKDDSYPWFLHWMTLYQQSQLSSARTAASRSGFMDSLLQRLTPGMRHLSIQTQKVEHSNGAIHTHFALVPGPGKHILRYKNAFIFVNRMRESKSLDLQTGRPWETITLTTLYSHRHIFEELFMEAHAYAAKSHEGKTSIYNSWGTEWKPFGQPRRKRPLESVILDEGVKERIVEDVKDFLSSGKWYHDRGIPYRRGYLLYGPPGTGKSSFIQALAGELDYDIAILNLSERGLTDDRLNHLLTIVPNRTIVLLEDVDAAFSNRRVQTDSDGYRGANVTFSGLLNAMDGVASAEERVIFLTTNHVERLDPALVRPGRVDMTIRLGEVSRYQVACLWDRFYGEIDTDKKYQQVFLNRLHELGLIENENGQEPDQPKATSAAALQGLFLYNKSNMEGAIAMAEALTYSVHDEAMEHDRSGGK